MPAVPSTTGRRWICTKALTFPFTVAAGSVAAGPGSPVTPITVNCEETQKGKKKQQPRVTPLHGPFLAPGRGKRTHPGNEGTTVCGLHKVCSHIMARSDLFLSTSACNVESHTWTHCGPILFYFIDAVFGANCSEPWH